MYAFLPLDHEAGAVGGLDRQEPRGHEAEAEHALGHLQLSRSIVSRPAKPVHAGKSGLRGGFGWCL